MKSLDVSFPKAGARTTDPADLIQRFSGHTAELRAEFAELDSGLKQCGQAFVELLEVIEDRLDALVTPARYRR